MRRKNVLKLVLIALLCFVGVYEGENTVHAASWHKGTPKVLRGTYQGKRESSAEGFGYIYKITSKSYDFNASNWPDRKTINVKNKKLKHNVYLLKGHMKKNGFVLGGKSSMVFYRKGKYLLTTDYTTYKKKKMRAFKPMRNPAIKTTHVKNGGKILHIK